MAADTTTRTLAKLQALARAASAPYRAALAPAVLLQIELGAIALWLSAQDDSLEPARLLELANATTAWVHSRY